MADDMYRTTYYEIVLDFPVNLQYVLLTQMNLGGTFLRALLPTIFNVTKLFNISNETCLNVFMKNRQLHFSKIPGPFEILAESIREPMINLDHLRWPGRRVFVMETAVFLVLFKSINENLYNILFFLNNCDAFTYQLLVILELKDLVVPLYYHAIRLMSAATVMADYYRVAYSI